MQVFFRRLVLNSLIGLVGVLLGLLVVELLLALWGFPVEVGYDAAGRDRMHYIYTITGLGKCYPSDPHGYFPYDLGREVDLRSMREMIADVSDLPDELSIPEKVEHLRVAAPFCNNVPLIPLNKGPYPSRQRQVLLIGDSFTFGEGLRLDDTIGSQLSELVPDTNFPNMGWPGTSIETIFDVSKGVERFAAVVYFYNINDVPSTDRLRERGYELHGVYRPGRGDDGDGPWFCDYWRLCQLVRQRQRRLDQSGASIEYYRDLYFSQENEEPRRRSFEKLAQMNRDVQAQGSRLIVAMFPLFYRPPLTEYPFRDIHDYVAAEAKNIGVEFVDLLPAYESRLVWDDLMVHPLDRHPSAEAIAVAARYLAPRLATVGAAAK